MYYTLLLISELAKNLYNDCIGNFFFLNRSYSYTYFHLVGCLDLVLTICCPPYNTTQDFEICIYYYIFQFDVWVAAMNNFEIKSKQNSSWCCCCAFIGKKLTNFNFENPNAFLFRNVNYLVLLIFSTKKNHNSI